MHIRNIDLNGLYLLSALLKERHVSRAAERCFLSQPAMSRVLERLRREFNDELLVRSGRKYERTPRGERILAELDRILPRIESLYSGGELPASVESVSLMMNDHACAVILPQILLRLRFAAPALRVEVRAFSDRRFEEVVAGRADLLFDAAGAPRDLETETLYEEDFACLVTRKHPVAGNFSLEEYLRFPHVSVAVLEGEQTFVDRALRGMGLYRKVGLVLPYFTPAPFALSGTEFVLTLPRRLARILGRNEDLRLVEPPVELARFPYQMIWHRRLSEDAVHRWLRGRVRDAVAALTTTGS